MHRLTLILYPWLSTFYDDSIVFLVDKGGDGCDGDRQERQILRPHAGGASLAGLESRELKSPKVRGVSYRRMLYIHHTPPATKVRAHSKID